MRPLLTAIALAGISLAVRAGDSAPANALTAKEAAEGWLLLFDGKTAFGWTAEGEVAVEKGVLTVGGTKASALRLNAQFVNFDLLIEYNYEGAKDASLSLSYNGGTNSQGLRLSQPTGKQRWNALRHTVTFDGSTKTGRERQEDRSTADVEHYLLSGAATPRTAVALSFEVPAGAKVMLRNVKLKPLGTNSLFNGKDLTGWRVFPGAKYKSKFTVTDKGEINVKDGPGDLQTVGKYDDFIVQFDCISNGKFLNSGVFFRCRDGEYQNGYEAQIRNQFTDEPKQSYVVEVFDPKTHKLIEKKKVTSTAVDYGTGAIYRRIPARFGVSKDGEWFTMTVLARGNHFATWVNGVQVVDWADNRPPNDNARNGCCLRPGHISIQGHDPTTDLSFKNLRLAELPRSDK